MRRCISITPLALILLACDSTSTPRTAEWSGTIDTLASGRIVIVNHETTGSRALGEPREVARIGSMEGSGADVFGDIRGLALGSAGELYVLDGQASEVRVFDAAGRHVRTFGRSGQGPGELNRPAGIAVDGDGRLWVLNWGNARYSAFDPSTGELIGERRRLAGFVSIPWPGAFDAAGRLMDVGLDRNGQPAALLLDTSFVPRDTVALPRADDRSLINFTRGDVRVMSVPDPFASRPVWAPHPDGDIVIGEGGAYRLHRVNARGDTTFTIEVNRQPVAVTRVERDSALAAFEQVMELAGGATPDRQPRVASHKPAHGAIFVDDRGRLWVRRPGTAAGTTWDVIDADGRLAGHVTVPVLPGAVAPSVRGDRLAIVTEVDEVPTIIVYELQ